MGRLTEALYAINSKDTSNFDNEHFFHLDIKNKAIRDEVMELRKVKRANNHPSLF